MSSDLQNSQNYDGGNSLTTSFSGDVGGGNYSQVTTPGACTFTARYKNVALTRDQLPLIDWTFRYKNQPAVGRFFKSSFNVCLQSDVTETINLSSFFHPFQSFSSYQKQTFVIDPQNTIDIDSGNFANTGNEVSFIFARAYYLPTATESEKVLFWDYSGSERYPMGQIMCLSGAIKFGTPWRGWDINPFVNLGHTGPSANLSIGGISFSNPTGLPVKIVVITAN